MAAGQTSVIEQEITNRLGGGCIESALDQLVDDKLREVNSVKIITDLNRVAESLGVKRVVMQPLPCDGYLRPLDDSGYEIGISSSAPKTRQRFSFAHELAHAIIHQLVPETRSFANRNVFLPPGHESEERLCDRIAARLLMPREHFEQQLESVPFGLQCIEDLAGRFGVSLSAAAIRIKEIKKIDFAFMFADEAVVRNKRAISVRRMIVDFRYGRLGLRSGDVFQGEGDVRFDVDSREGEGSVWVKITNIRRLLRVYWRPVSSSQQMGWKLIFSKSQITNEFASKKETARKNRLA